MARQPVFIGLTIFGNTVIAGSAGLLVYLERGINQAVGGYLDGLWWAASTVTTVGYGDVVPITDGGRVLGIFTIIIGAALFWSYTALFAEALLAKDLDDVEAQLRSFSRTLKSLAGSEAREQKEIEELLEQIRRQLNERA